MLSQLVLCHAYTPSLIITYKPGMPFSSHSGLFVHSVNLNVFVYFSLVKIITLIVGYWLICQLDLHTYDLSGIKHNSVSA